MCSWDLGNLKASMHNVVHQARHRESRSGLFEDYTNFPPLVSNFNRYLQHVVMPVAHEHEVDVLLDTMMRIIDIAKRHGRHTIFRTAASRLGVGPRGCAVGDRVFVLEGSKYPTLLREKASYRAHVGTCLIPELMGGEAARTVRSDNVKIREVVIE
ncbi:hypothetical protein V8E51_009901 [Hyaloscypha variabilis]